MMTVFPIVPSIKAVGPLRDHHELDATVYLSKFTVNEKSWSGRSYRAYREDYDEWYKAEGQYTSVYILDLRHWDVALKGDAAASYIHNVQKNKHNNTLLQRLSAVMCPFYSDAADTDGASFRNGLCTYYDFILKEVDAVNIEHEQFIVYLTRLGPAIRYIKAAMYLRGSPWAIRNHRYSRENLEWSLSLRDLGDMATVPWMPRKDRTPLFNKPVNDQLLRNPK